MYNNSTNYNVYTIFYYAFVPNDIGEHLNTIDKGTTIMISVYLQELVEMFQAFCVVWIYIVIISFATSLQRLQTKEFCIGCLLSNSMHVICYVPRRVHQRLVPSHVRMECVGYAQIQYLLQGFLLQNPIC